ncbi:hypothetical protein FNH22_07020 [Fulvivirga sp. M361]|uniref:SRPBCC family protein n=1 Tax=Fulvivirga sp. M361 TaxID=2594266 RepID=UPI00117B07A1|nr:SRPBCC family protein [Fulvivirga sp. M361]TRX60785.1 hypothetical protein FNH22_07020 [Fulvivirga sp. M361]
MIKNKAPSFILGLFMTCSAQLSVEAASTQKENELKPRNKIQKMTKLNYDFKINASADAVWKIVGDLAACDQWVPGVTSTVLEGNNRTCTTVDGTEIKEVITLLYEEKRLFSYKQLQVPLPITASEGTFQVIEDGHQSRIIWNVKFSLLAPSTSKKLVPMIDGYYKQTLEHLKRSIENNNSVAMKEYVALIKAEGNPITRLPQEDQMKHIQKVGGFIEKMMKEGKMKAAEPLEMEGAVIHGKNGSFTDGPFVETKETIAGYYIITAHDLREAIDIVKADPRFEDATWEMEIRPVMKVEGIN